LSTCSMRTISMRTIRYALETGTDSRYRHGTAN
jgi:hypothetical protein